MDRLTRENWRNLDPWECCGQDHYCKRECHEKGGCNNGCIVPRIYVRLAKYEDIGLTPDEIQDLNIENKKLNNENILKQLEKERLLGEITALQRLCKVNNAKEG